MDKQIEDIFFDAIESFPPEIQKAAETWLLERVTAHKVIEELENGIETLLTS